VVFEETKLPGAKADVEGYYTWLYSQSGGDWYGYHAQELDLTKACLRDRAMALRDLIPDTDRATVVIDACGMLGGLMRVGQAGRRSLPHQVQHRQAHRRDACP
jgi:hypothetical protein